MNDQLALRLSVRSRWMAYALDPDTAAETVAREVDAQIARLPHLAPRRGLLIDLLTSKSAGARADHAGVGALRYQDHPAHGSTIASMVGWLLDRNPARRVDEEISDNLSRFAVQSRFRRSPPRARRVRLRNGNGVRLESTRPARAAHEVPTEQQMVFQTVEYHVPLDTPRAALLFVRFVASRPPRAGQLVGEFDAIVEDIELAPAP